MQQCQPVNESIYGRQTDTDRKRLQWQERGEEMSFPIPYTSKSLTSSKESPMTRTVIPVLLFFSLPPLLLSSSSDDEVCTKVCISCRHHQWHAIFFFPLTTSVCRNEGIHRKNEHAFHTSIFPLYLTVVSPVTLLKKTKRKRPKQEYAGRRRRFLRWGITFSNFLPFSFAWISVSLFLFPYHLTAKLHGVKAYHIIIYCRSSEAFEKLWEEDWFCRSCRWSS